MVTLTYLPSPSPEEKQIVRAIATALKDPKTTPAQTRAMRGTLASKRKQATTVRLKKENLTFTPGQSIKVNHTLTDKEIESLNQASVAVDRWLDFVCTSPRAIRISLLDDQIFELEAKAPQTISLTPGLARNLSSTGIDVRPVKSEKKGPIDG